MTNKQFLLMRAGGLIVLLVIAFFAWKGVYEAGKTQKNKDEMGNKDNK